MNIRPPAVSGTFYPHDAHDLEKNVVALLAKNQTQARIPKALVAPHAGYRYSGSIAASAYACLQLIAQRITRVVLLGPSHRVPFSGVATPDCDAFLSPLGNIPICSELVSLLESHPEVAPFSAAHALEHSLEVHLPFLQCILGDFSLVPLVVGNISAERMADILESIPEDENTLIIVSSDLSHFLPYDRAVVCDANTTDAIVKLDASLSGEQACGCRPLNGLIELCARRALAIQALDVRNSGDTAGDKSRVVGYGAYVVY